MRDSDPVPTLDPLHSTALYARSRALNARLAEQYDRMSPAAAGAIAGTLGGLGAFWALELLHRARGTASALELLAACPIAAASPGGVGSAAAAALGLVLGVTFALVTRHVRRWSVLVVWSTLFFPVAWLAVFAFTQRGVPALATIGFVPTLLACLTFALSASLQLPLRRRRPRLVLVDDEEDEADVC